MRQLYVLWLPLVFLMVPILFALTNRSRIDRLIGELSYPVYLIHPHVLMFTIPFLHDEDSLGSGAARFRHHHRRVHHLLPLHRVEDRTLP